MGKLVVGLAIVLSLGVLVGNASAQNGDRRDAAAVLQDRDGARVGMVTFVQQGDRVLVQATASGLSPGFHGFHVHSVGACTGDFTGAGAHLNLVGMTHAGHNGDMPVLLVTADGTAQASFTTDRFTVSDLLAPGGRAVIVHADADNYDNIPARYGVVLDDTTLGTGDAGARVACGIVQ